MFSKINERDFSSLKNLSLIVYVQMSIKIALHIINKYLETNIRYLIKVQLLFLKKFKTL